MRVLPSFARRPGQEGLWNVGRLIYMMEAPIIRLSGVVLASVETSSPRTAFSLLALPLM